jgi:hypothetical protein
MCEDEEREFRRKRLGINLVKAVCRNYKSDSLQQCPTVKEASFCAADWPAQNEEETRGAYMLSL